MIIKFKISADKVSIKNPEKTNYNSKNKKLYKSIIRKIIRNIKKYFKVL